MCQRPSLGAQPPDEAAPLQSAPPPRLLSSPQLPSQPDCTEPGAQGQQFPHHPLCPRTAAPLWSPGPATRNGSRKQSGSGFPSWCAGLSSCRVTSGGPLVTVHQPTRGHRYGGPEVLVQAQPLTTTSRPAGKAVMENIPPTSSNNSGYNNSQTTASHANILQTTSTENDNNPTQQLQTVTSTELEATTKAFLELTPKTTVILLTTT